MKYNFKKIPLAFCFVAFGIFSPHAQQINQKKCGELFIKVREFYKSGNYEMALKKLSAIKILCPDYVDSVDRLLINVYNEINNQRNTAIEQQRLTESQLFATASYAFADKDPTLALNFSVASGIENNTAKAALVKAFNSGSWFYTQHFTDIVDADISIDGKQLLLLKKGKLEVLDLENGKTIKFGTTLSNVEQLRSGNILLWSGWNGLKTEGSIILLSPSLKIITSYTFAFLKIQIAVDGKVLVPFFSNDRKMSVYEIDPYTGEKQTYKLPEEFADLSIECNTIKGKGIIVAETFGQICIQYISGTSLTFSAPREYLIRDLDVDSNIVVLYLQGNRRGMSDAVGIIQLKELTNPSINISSIAGDIGGEGGSIRLFSNKIIFSSTSGWTKIFDTNSKDTVVISARRASDAIAIYNDKLLAMARRSGVVAIYDGKGHNVGFLMGVGYSDGLNPAFTKIKFTKDGNTILTVTHNGDVRIWNRPNYNLTIVHNQNFHMFDELPKSELIKLNDFKGPTALSFNSHSNNLFINDYGQIALTFTLNRQDYLIETKLSKDDFYIVGSGNIKDLGYRFIGEEYDRVFVLNPETIFTWASKQLRTKKILALSLKQLSMYKI